MGSPLGRWVCVRIPWELGGVDIHGPSPGIRHAQLRTDYTPKPLPVSTGWDSADLGLWAISAVPRDAEPISAPHSKASLVSLWRLGGRPGGKEAKTISKQPACLGFVSTSDCFLSASGTGVQTQPFQPTVGPPEVRKA